MTSENNSQIQKLCTSIAKLSKIEDYPVWAVRVKAAFSSSTLWAKDKPTDNSLTNALMLTLVDDYFVNQLLDSDLKASTIWAHISGLYNVSDLASQTIALTDLVAFDYAAPTMLDNKTKLLDLQRHLKSAFGGEDKISLSELVLLFALVNLPAAYVSLRATLLTTQNSETPLTLNALFTSLSSEEKTQSVTSTSTANRAAQSPSSPSPCPHGRVKSKCYTCTPSSRPTCSLCVSAGLPAESTRHRSGHPRLCSSKGKSTTSTPASSSSALSSSSAQTSSQARAASSSGGVQFIVDSGSTDHDVFNKDDVNIYSHVHHPIEVANGQFEYATAVGSLPSSVLPLKEVLVVPTFKQNLLSASKLDKDGYDTLFSKGKVYIGKNFQPSVNSIIVQGHLSNGSYFVTIPTSSAHSAASIQDWHVKLNHLHESALHKLGEAGLLPIQGCDKLGACSSCMIGKAKKGTVPKHSTFSATRPGEIIHSDICGPIKPTSLRGYTYFIIFVDDHTRFCTVFLMKQKSEAFHCFTVFAKQVENRFNRPITFFHSDNEIVLKSQQFLKYFEANGIVPLYSCRYSPHQNGTAERMMLSLLNPVRSMLTESRLDKKYWCYALLYAATSRNVSPTSAKALTPFEAWQLRAPVYDRFAAFGQPCIVTVPLIDRQRTGTSKLSRGVKGIFLGFAPNKKGYLIELESGKIIDCTYQDVKFLSSDSSAPIPSLLVPQSPSINLQLSVNEPSPDNSTESDAQEFADAQEDFIDEASLPDDYESVVGEQPAEEPGTPADSPRLPLGMPTEPFLSLPHIIQPHTTNSSSTTTTVARESASPSSTIHQGSGIWNQWKWTTDPPKKALEGILPPGSKRSRKEVHYSEARSVFSPNLNVAQLQTNATKSAAFSAVVTHMHAAFSTVDSVVQLSNHGHHQWYRSRAYSASAPHSYLDIANTTNPDDWYKAADEEISQLIKYGTWNLVPPPDGANIMKNTWVFRIKEKDGVVVRYKARLCACGYSQIAGVDYKELFSPTIHSSSFRLHLALIAQRKMVTKQMDVTGAFLNGVPEEVLHMKQPEGYIDPDHPNWVCRLLRNIYGLKQAPRVWHKTVDPFIKSLGFTPTAGDPCLYFRWNEEMLSIISLHVDDFTISSDSAAQLASIASALSNKFEMTDDGELHHVLGLTIERDLTKNLLYISQKSYIRALLEKFSMNSSKPVKTPMDSLTVSSSDCPLPGSEEQLEMMSVPYREACGALMSLAINSRPDILYAVGVTCRYMHNPGHAH